MANFDDFLAEVDPINDIREDEGQDYPLTGFVKEDEIKSVNRFRSLNNSPPSLYALCIIRVASFMNELTCDPANIQNGSVHKYHDGVKLLPEDIQATVVSQLSFTTLQCLFKGKIWDQDPLVIAAGIKQEEDMLRYLYWKNPTSPLLRRFEKSLTIDVFADSKWITQFNNKHLAPTDRVEEGLVQTYIKTCFNYQFNDKEKFQREFEVMSSLVLKKINWKNVLVVGGSVLKSLRHQKTGPTEEHLLGRYDNSDIDIYIYGLTTKEATAKVVEIYNAVKEAWKESPVAIFKTANTITLVGDVKFRPIQIILSTYASPLEILLASDMNSCSIGYNGSTVLTIPRFIFGAMYGSNILDSSTKFGAKLRWERLSKYYIRGYNIVSPLHIRVHGYGSFNSEEKIGRNIHPSTRQLIELMCLNKMKLFSLSLEKERYGIDRESSFNCWPERWTRGITIMERVYLDGWGQEEFKMLSDLLPSMPDWIKNYYKRAQDLRMLPNSIREAPRYADNVKTLSNLSWGDQSKNYNPEKKSTNVQNYAKENCKFDEYNESSLQCFHLNFFVDKDQNAPNPYKEMNTSLVPLKYTIQVVPLAVKEFDKLLSGEIKTISVPFKVLGRNWKLMFNWASDAILITSLTKDADEEDQLTANNSRSRPTKFFANFLLRVKTQKEVTLAKDSRNRAPKHITIDGSQVFTYTEPSNTWLTWIRSDYIRGRMNAAAEEWLQRIKEREHKDARPKYVSDDGTAQWEVTLQLIEPQLDVVNF